MSERESLVLRREDLEQLVQQERNRQLGLLGRPSSAAAVHRSLARILDALDKEVRAIAAALDAHLEHHAELRAAARRLQTVPGVGTRNVLWLVVLLYRWQTHTAGRGRAKGLVAYVGLDPQPFESGTSVWRRARISRMGAAPMRRRLFMSAFGGVRGKTVLRQFYDQRVGRGKPKQVALIAAARKILVWSWAVFRTGTSFDPDLCTRRRGMAALQP